MGCNLGVWRDVFEDLGGFDPDFGIGGDEVGLSFDAQLRGYKLIAVDEAVLLRRERSGIRAVVRQSRQYGNGEARLARSYRAAGYPSGIGIRSALRLGRRLTRAPFMIRSHDDRREWCRGVAFHGGVVEGALRQSLASR
jgi:hypothetical protein